MIALSGGAQGYALAANSGKDGTPRRARPSASTAAQKKRPGQSNSVRIIGGEWRGRRIRFPSAAELRPTPDRVRETLFNWLQGVIGAARCLDLFAGSGALGLEALSRGAAEVVFVEREPRVAAALKATLAALGSGRSAVVTGDAFRYLAGAPRPFDVVFLDPPFAQGRLPELCTLLENGGMARAARVRLPRGRRARWHSAAARSVAAGARDPRRRGARRVGAARGPGGAAGRRRQRADGRDMNHKRSAVYPGTFDPVTNGHEDLVRRAASMFERVCVAIAANPNKTPMFPLTMRVDMAQARTRTTCRTSSVLGYSGLTVDFAKQQARVIVRGLRAVSDFEFEFQLANMSRHLCPTSRRVPHAQGAVHVHLLDPGARDRLLGGNVSEFVHPSWRRSSRSGAAVATARPARVREMIDDVASSAPPLPRAAAARCRWRPARKTFARCMRRAQERRVEREPLGQPSGP